MEDFIKLRWRVREASMLEPERHFIKEENIDKTLAYSFNYNPKFNHLQADNSRRKVIDGGKNKNKRKKLYQQICRQKNETKRIKDKPLDKTVDNKCDNKDSSKLVTLKNSENHIVTDSFDYSCDETSSKITKRIDNCTEINTDLVANEKI